MSSSPEQFTEAQPQSEVESEEERRRRRAEEEAEEMRARLEREAADERVRDLNERELERQNKERREHAQYHGEFLKAQAGVAEASNVFFQRERADIDPYRGADLQSLLKGLKSGPQDAEQYQLEVATSRPLSDQERVAFGMVAAGEEPVSKLQRHYRGLAREWSLDESAAYEKELALPIDDIILTLRKMPKGAPPVNFVQVGKQRLPEIVQMAQEEGRDDEFTYLLKFLAGAYDKGGFQKPKQVSKYVLPDGGTYEMVDGLGPTMHEIRAPEKPYLLGIHRNSAGRVIRYDNYDNYDPKKAVLVQSYVPTSDGMIPTLGRVQLPTDLSSDWVVRHNQNLPERGLIRLYPWHYSYHSVRDVEGDSIATVLNKAGQKQIDEDFPLGREEADDILRKGVTIPYLYGLHGDFDVFYESRDNAVVIPGEVTSSSVAISHTSEDPYRQMTTFHRTGSLLRREDGVPIGSVAGPEGYASGWSRQDVSPDPLQEGAPDPRLIGSYASIRRVDTGYVYGRGYTNLPRLRLSGDDSFVYGQDGVAGTRERRQQGLEATKTALRFLLVRHVVPEIGRADALVKGVERYKVDLYDSFDRFGNQKDEPPGGFHPLTDSTFSTNNRTLWEAWRATSDRRFQGPSFDPKTEYYGSQTEPFAGLNERREKLKEQHGDFHPETQWLNLVRESLDAAVVSMGLAPEWDHPAAYAPPRAVPQVSPLWKDREQKIYEELSSFFENTAAVDDPVKRAKMRESDGRENLSGPARLTLESMERAGLYPFSRAVVFDASATKAAEALRDLKNAMEDKDAGKARKATRVLAEARKEVRERQILLGFKRIWIPKIFLEAEQLLLAKPSVDLPKVMKKLNFDKKDSLIIKAGVDFGHLDPATVREAYASLFSEEESFAGAKDYQKFLEKNNWRLDFTRAGQREVEQLAESAGKEPWEIAQDENVVFPEEFQYSYLGGRITPMSTAEEFTGATYASVIGLPYGIMEGLAEVIHNRIMPHFLDDWQPKDTEVEDKISGIPGYQLGRFAPHFIEQLYFGVRETLEQGPGYFDEKSDYYNREKEKLDKGLRGPNNFEFDEDGNKVGYIDLGRLSDEAADHASRLYPKWRMPEWWYKDIDQLKKAKEKEFGYKIPDYYGWDTGWGKIPIPWWLKHGTRDLTGQIIGLVTAPAHIVQEIGLTAGAILSPGKPSEKYEQFGGLVWGLTEPFAMGVMAPRFGTAEQGIVMQSLIAMGAKKGAVGLTRKGAGAARRTLLGKALFAEHLGGELLGRQPSTGRYSPYTSSRLYSIDKSTGKRTYYDSFDPRIVRGKKGIYLEEPIEVPQGTIRGPTTKEVEVTKVGERGPSGEMLKETVTVQIPEAGTLRVAFEVENAKLTLMERQQRTYFERDLIDQDLTTGKAYLFSKKYGRVYLDELLIDAKTKEVYKIDKATGKKTVIEELQSPTYEGSMRTKGGILAAVEARSLWLEERIARSHEINKVYHEQVVADMTGVPNPALKGMPRAYATILEKLPQVVEMMGTYVNPLMGGLPTMLAPTQLFGLIAERFILRQPWLERKMRGGLKSWSDARKAIGDRGLPDFLTYVTKRGEVRPSLYFFDWQMHSKPGRLPAGYQYLEYEQLQHQRKGDWKRREIAAGSEAFRDSFFDLANDLLTQEAQWITLNKKAMAYFEEYALRRAKQKHGMPPEGPGPAEAADFNPEVRYKSPKELFGNMPEVEISSKVGDIRGRLITLNTLQEAHVVDVARLRDAVSNATGPQKAKMSAELARVEKALDNTNRKIAEVGESLAQEMALHGQKRPAFDSLVDEIASWERDPLGRSVPLAEVREAINVLNERIKKKPMSKNMPEQRTAQRTSVLEWDPEIQAWKVDTYVRKIVDPQTLLSFEAYVHAANKLHRNLEVRIQAERAKAIELGRFSNELMLDQMYFPAQYEFASFLREKFRSLEVRFRDYATNETTAGKMHLEMMEAAQDYMSKTDKNKSVQHNAGVIAAELKRMGVPIETRRAIHGQLSGKKGFTESLLKGMAELEKDNAMYQLYRDIRRKHPEMYRLEAPTTGRGAWERMSKETRKEKGKDTGIPIHGDIAGLWVDKRIALELRMAEQFMEYNSKFFGGLVKFWKGTKTHQNAPTTLRNLISLVMFQLPMAGVSLLNPANWVYVRQAYKDLVAPQVHPKAWKNPNVDYTFKQKSRMFREAYEAGFDTGTWMESNVGRQTGSNLLRGFVGNSKHFYDLWANIFKFDETMARYKWSDKGAKAWKAAVGTYWDLPGVLYNVMETFGRYVVWLKERYPNLGNRKLGNKRFLPGPKTAYEATRATERMGADYNQLQTFLNNIQSPRGGFSTAVFMTIGFPFISFVARAIPAFYKWLQRDPVQAAIYEAIYNHLQAHGEADSGLTSEQYLAARDMLPGSLRHRYFPVKSKTRIIRDEKGNIIDLVQDYEGLGFLSPVDIAFLSSEVQDSSTWWDQLTGFIGPRFPTQQLTGMFTGATVQMAKQGSVGRLERIWTESAKLGVDHSGLDQAKQAFGWLRDQFISPSWGIYPFPHSLIMPSDKPGIVGKAEGEQYLFTGKLARRLEAYRAQVPDEDGRLWSERAMIGQLLGSPYHRQVLSADLGRQGMLLRKKFDISQQVARAEINAKYPQFGKKISMDVLLHTKAITSLDGTETIPTSVIRKEWDLIAAKRMRDDIKTFYEDVGRLMVLFPHLPNLAPENRQGLLPDEQLIGVFRGILGTNSVAHRWRLGGYKIITNPKSAEEWDRHRIALETHYSGFVKHGKFGVGALDKPLTKSQRALFREYREKLLLQIKALDKESPKYADEKKKLIKESKQTVALAAKAMDGIPPVVVQVYKSLLEEGAQSGEDYYNGVRRESIRQFYDAVPTPIKEAIDALESVPEEDVDEKRKVTEAIFKEMEELGKRIEQKKLEEE